MGFAPPRDEGQYEACMRAYRPRVFTAPMVAAAAAAGELTDGMGRPMAPFEISPNTVRSWARERRDEDQAGGAAPVELTVAEGDELGQALADVLAAMRAEVAEARKATRAGKTATRRLLDAARLAREAEKLEERLRRRGTAGPPRAAHVGAPASSTPAAEPGRAAGSLLRDHRASPPAAPAEVEERVRAGQRWLHEDEPEDPEVDDRDPVTQLVEELRSNLEHANGALRERHQAVLQEATAPIRGPEEDDTVSDADRRFQRRHRQARRTREAIARW